MGTKDDEGAVTFWTLEADAAVVLDKPEIPNGLDLQELASRRYATGWDDDYEQIVYDFETQSTFRSDDGELGGNLYAVNDWSDEELVVYELPMGKKIASCANENVGAVVVLESRPQLFFTTYDGGLTTWQPPNDPVEVYSRRGPRRASQVCR